MRYRSKKDWGPLTRELRPIYTAAAKTAAETALAAFVETWSAGYPAIATLVRALWAESPRSWVPAGRAAGRVYDESH